MKKYIVMNQSKPSAAAHELLERGDTVKLKHPSYSSHRFFTWEEGMIVDFSNDCDECTITAIVKNKQKAFVEFTDNLVKVKPNEENN